MEGERKQFRLTGMDDRPIVEPGYGERVVNLTCDSQGAWRNCNEWWWIHNNANSAPTYWQNTVAWQSLFWWGQRGAARQWMIWERAVSTTQTNLEVFDGLDPATGVLVLNTTRTRVTAPDPGSMYVPIGGWLYIINGYDQAVRWNGRGPDYGSELVQVGFVTKPPPLVATKGVTDVVSSGHLGVLGGTGMAFGVGVTAEFRYGYAMTYLNDVGAESPPSEVVFVSGTNATAEYLNVKLQWGTPPPNVRACRLYRTSNIAAAGPLAVYEGVRWSLYHLRDIPVASQQTYLDGCRDALLGHELDSATTGLFPIGTRYAAHFKGTLFLAGAPSYPDRVFYSAPGLIEQFPAANTFDVGGATGAEVMGLHATRNGLAVFTRRGVYLIKGDPMNGFYVETVSSEVGCIAPGAIASVPGERPAVMFFDVEGPYLLIPGEASPSSLTFIGERIRGFWNLEVNHAGMMGARVARNRRDEEIVFVVPTNGIPVLTRQMGLVYHYLHGYWSLRDFGSTALTTSIPIGAMCEIGDHRGLIAIGVDDVYVSASRATASDLDGTAGTAWLYRLGWAGLRDERGTIQRLEVLGHMSSREVAFASSVVKNVTTIRTTGVRWREDRKPMPEIDFTLAWTPDALIPLPVAFDVLYPQPGQANMVEAEYTADTWEYSYWGSGVWQREAPRVYAFDVRAAGYEIQLEIASGGVGSGPVVMMGAAFVYVGGPRQGRHSQQRGSERP